MEGRAAPSATDHDKIRRPREGEHMRRIASVASFIALIWLALLSFSTTEARAYWSGASVDPACPGGGGLAGSCPSAGEACFSWALYYNPDNPAVLSMTPFYNSNGALAGYSCRVRYVPIEDAGAPTMPGCATGNSDALAASGCSDFYQPDPEQLGCDCDKSGKSTPVGDPVNLAIGNTSEVVTDYQSAGPDKLEFKRHYNAQSSRASPLGFGWKSNYDRLTLSRFSGPPSGSSYNLMWRPDGALLYFNKTATGWAMEVGDNDIVIASDGATVWTITDSNDTVETYGYVSGQLLSIRTRSGYQQTLAYDANGNLAAVTDSYNRTLSFTYADGVLQTMTDPDGRVYAYGYDSGSLPSSNRLVGVTYPGAAPSPRIQYLYENATFPYALTGIIDENGNRAASWTYDSARRVIANQRGGGADSIAIAYNPAGDNSASVTNALGETFYYFFRTVQYKGKLWAHSQSANGTVPNIWISWTGYDGFGFVASRTDKNGIVTNYQNDDHGRGLVLSKTEAAGTAQARTTTYAWHPTFHLPIQIVEPGRTTAFTYDANGFLLTKTQTDTTSSTVPYGTAGRTRSWSYTYTSAGLLASVTGPRTDVAQTTSYGWDASGTLVSVTNALGQVTQVTSHDPRGRLTSTTAAGATTTIAYDAAGNVTRITRPDGSLLAYGYDTANRLVRVSNALDERIDYTLDALGGRTLEQIHGSGGTAL